MSEEIEDASDAWSGDLFDRSRDADFLFYFLLARSEEQHRLALNKSYVMNINAAWGQGKTFFLERFAAQIMQAGHLVASVNAWEDDHADDPLLAVMASLDKVLTEDKKIAAKTKSLGKKLVPITGEVVAAATKGLIKQTASRYLGAEAAEVIKEAIKGNEEAASTVAKSLEGIWDKEVKSLLDRFQQNKRTLAKFKGSLKGFIDELRAEKKAPLFVLVDELDRCRPTYAITLLERIKHLFDIDGIVFVVATDTDQLQYAIGAVYGSGFDSKKYLGRFFDSSYSFENSSYRALVSSALETRPIDLNKVSLLPEQSFEKLLSEGIDYCGLSLREAYKAYDLLANILALWSKKAPVQLNVLVPLVLGHVLGLTV